MVIFRIRKGPASKKKKFREHKFWQIVLMIFKICNSYLVNKTNRCTEFQFYWYYYSVLLSSSTNNFFYRMTVHRNRFLVNKIDLIKHTFIILFNVLFGRHVSTFYLVIIRPFT